MSGERTKRLKRSILRWNLTAGSVVGGLIVVTLIAASMIDVVTTALAKDRKVQESTLTGELAQFALALRDDDGTSLLENIHDFASAKRTLRAVAVRQSFFSYFLKESNARNLTAKGINWEAPRSCAVDFVDGSGADSPRTLRACFAVVSEDASGRYIYFSLRYPSDDIIRHRPGASLDQASSVSLRLKGDVPFNLRLVFIQPRLVEARYPSQARRFSGIHEIAAYGDQNGTPIRAVQAQAFEKRGDSAEGAAVNYVTILGRLDPALVFSSQRASDNWASGWFRRLEVGFEAFQPSAGSMNAVRHLAVPFGTQGSALQSLEQAYYTYVQSRATLEIFGANSKLLWTSNSITASNRPGLDFFQQISNRWARLMVTIFDYKKQAVQIGQAVRSQDQQRLMLTSEPVVLSDLAARAFLGLSAALAAVFLLGLYWLHGILQLRRITKLALSRAHIGSTDSMPEYRSRRDEIGTLGRTFDLVIRRLRARNSSVFEKIRKLDRQRQEKLRLADEQIRARQDVLKALGHEIRSPLQSLLNRTTDHPELRQGLEKMRRAVEALYFSASVEEGLQARPIVCSEKDLAAFLKKLTENLNEGGDPVEYLGPSADVSASFDSFALDDVLSSVLDNASCHKHPDTKVRIDLQVSEATVSIEICNEGPPIPEEDLDDIFTFGFSTHKRAENTGLGLFSARVYVLGMRGSIRARNSVGGVTISIVLPRSAPEA